MGRANTWLAAITVMWLMPWDGALAQEESIRVSVARANIRAEPSVTSPVLTQVTSGTELTLKSVQGDWFQVELRMGGLRIEGWVSNTVAARMPAAAAETRAPSPTPVQDRYRVSVGVQSGSGGEASWLTPQTAAVRVIDAAANSLRGLLSVFPADERPPTATGDAPATFVWTLPGRTSDRVIEGRRPILLLSYANVDGIPPAEIVPAIVRLASTLSGVRLVASVRAPANQGARTAADWNLARDLRQDVVRSALEVFEPGSARLQPSSNLEPGEYAVVMRLRSPVSGESALSAGGAGRLLSTVWAFSIR